jgi:hypothetical protein
MILLRQVPLSSTETAELNKWFALPGTLLFRKILRARAAEAATDVGNAVFDSTEAGENTVKEASEKAKLFNAMFEFIANLSEGAEEKAYTIELKPKPITTIDNEPIR